MDDSYEIAEALDAISHQLARIADVLEEVSEGQGVAHPKEGSTSDDQ